MITAFGATDRTIASDENREIAHHLTFGADLVLYGSILWHVGTNAPRHKTAWPWGPFLLTICGVILSFVDITRHILLDHGGVICEPERMAMYAAGGALTPVGEFCKRASILGMVLLMAGVMWFVGIPGKLYSSVVGDEAA